MAINPQNFEKPNKMKWSSDEQNTSQVRSYICGFCERGFSNAQALGGHMNIHRRDRARLKQAADENSLSFDITTNPTDHEPQALEENILETGCPGRNEKKDMQSSHASRQTAKVDLELRLGPEPPETSTVSTREFF